MNTLFLLNRSWCDRNRSDSLFQATKLTAGVCKGNLELHFTDIDGKLWRLVCMISDEARDDLSSTLSKHFSPLDLPPAE
jgi:hypothetical protein